MTVSFIVHGAVWPDALTAGRVRERLAAAVPEAQILDAREHDASPRGAAATINQAVAHATGDLLVMLEPWDVPSAPWLADLCARARELLASTLSPHAGRGGPWVVVESDEHDGPDLEWLTAEAPEDLLAHLSTLSTAPAVTRARTTRGPICAIARAALASAGGLDERLGSVGWLDDVAARLGGNVARVPGDPATRDAPAAWPLDDQLAGFLHARNRLITAFKRLDADALGIELARVAVEQILRAWRRSGWRADDFRFGGDWGANETRLASLLRPGSQGAARLGDHEGVLAPLLALDAFLDEVPSLLAQRQQQAAPSPAPAPAATDATASRSNASTPALPDQPQVSVIVVNWNGLEHLEPCVRSLLASDYPHDRLELICVDNGSTDGSVAWLRQTFPTVRIVELDRNLGFTGGNRAGVAGSRGDVLVFFNNDMRVAPDAISRLVAALDLSDRDGAPACVAARVLSWDGRFIDFLRGSLNLEGRGFQDAYGEPADVERQMTVDTFFPNGGAFAVTRAAYTRAGGFDESLFAYYDDVDLGWRLRLTGAAIRIEDRAVVWHRHGATARTQPAGQKRFLMERNALTVLARSYGERALRRTFGVTLLLAVRRTLDDSRFGTGPSTLASLAPWSRRIRDRFRVAAAEDAAMAPAGSRRVLRGFAAESFAALGAALDDLPRLVTARAELQRARRTPDAEVLSHFGRTFETLSSASSYQAIYKGLTTALELRRLFNPRTRLLIISHEAIATNMSGPAVRFLELGRALAPTARVTIAMPGRPSLRDDRCTLTGFDPASPAELRRLAEDCDVLFVQGFALTQYPFLTEMMLPIVVDLYCPFTIEHLEQTRGDAVRAQPAPDILAALNAQLDAGDYFICASEAQRDFWLGNLHSRGRINPLTYAADPTLRNLVDIVPFGLPDEPFEAAVTRARDDGGAVGAGPVMKGVRPGIGPDDKVLLWAGSLLDWQDPLTLIRAVADIASKRPDVKLFFMGTKHPNPHVAPMRVVEESRTLARELGVLDTHVIFNDWVPYAQRARYLAEADLGVSTHHEHLETHFSFRTRMLDYVWARLPIVCTGGDVFADLVATRGLGLAVPPGDVGAIATAIETMLDDRARRTEATERLARLAHAMRWSEVAGPLRAYCRDPHLAADHAPGLDAIRARLERQFKVSRWLKRTALRVGVSEMRVEQVKRFKAVQSLMQLRNRLAIARARR